METVGVIIILIAVFAAGFWTCHARNYLLLTLLKNKVEQEMVKANEEAREEIRAEFLEQIELIKAEYVRHQKAMDELEEMHLREVKKIKESNG